jgi:serine/threonine protein kinase
MSSCDSFASLFTPVQQPAGQVAEPISIDVMPPKEFITRYRTDSTIGKGAFGEVFAATDLHSGLPVAIKQVQNSEQVRREIEVGMRVKSQNLCRTLAFTVNGPHMFIAMELIQGIELSDFIDQNPGFFLKNPEIFTLVVRDILRAIEHMHTLRIAHRDLKPENVMLKQKPRTVEIESAVVIDFGFAMSVSEIPENAKEGSLEYIAPEILTRLFPKTEKVDIWATGVTIFCMMYNAFPISSRHDDKNKYKMEVLYKLSRLQGALQLPLYNEGNPHICKIREVMMRCLQVDPTHRATSTELLAMLS